MATTPPVKKLYALIEDVKVRKWMAVFVIWLVAITIWNYTWPEASPFADVVAAVILSLLTTRAHIMFTKLRKSE